MPYDYFLAHSGADTDLAWTLYSLLKERGARVFLDTASLRPGYVWGSCTASRTTGFTYHSCDDFK